MTIQKFREKHRAVFLISHLLMTSSVIALAPVAVAQAQSEMTISVPAGDLGATLKRISELSGVKIQVDPDAVRGKRSQAVEGAKTAEGAIVAALENTDSNLAIRRNDDGSLTVFADVAAESGDLVMDEIVVIARRDEAETNYRVNKTGTSDRFGGTLSNLAQNTAVVSDKLMRDQQIQTINEAIRNVAGGTASLQARQGLSGFSVRGFGVSPLINGGGQTASSSNSGSGVMPLSNVERVEVLKGPAAILAGQGNFGGTVNVVTKKPSAETRLVATGEYQTGDSTRIVADGSTALNESKTFSARIIGEAQHADHNQARYDGPEKYLITPSLRFKNEKSDFIVSFSYMDQHISAPYETMINTHEGAPIAVGEFIDRPKAPIGRENAGIDVTNTSFTFDATQEVAEWLTLSARGDHYNMTVDLLPITTLFSPAYAQVFAFNSHAMDKNKGNTFDGYARFKLSTMGIKHTLVTGVNYTDLGINHFDAPSDFVQIDTLDPHFRVPTNTNPLDLSFTLDYREYGIYAQDLIEYGPVHLSLAIRKNWYKVDSVVNWWSGTRVGSEEANSSVPAFGLVVDLTPQISLFASYAKGFVPITALAFDGSQLPDIRSTNKEAGIKAELFEDRASLVASVFQTEQDNRIIGDREHPGFSTSIPGGQRARGFDATLTGQIMPGLNINATYAYTKFDFSNAEAAAEAGLTVVEGQPAHSYSLFASYEPKDGMIGGALGVFGNSSSFVESFSTWPPTVFTVPGGAQIDGNIYVRLGDAARLNIGVKNIFDKRLYSPSTSDISVTIKDARTLTATLTYRFF